MNKVRLAVVGSLALSSSAFAANYAIEARGDAMGGTGVVAATYLTAPFYNPALTAIYRRNDDAGMILPSLGLMYDDSFQIEDKIDLISDSVAAGSLSADAIAAMNSLNGSQAKLEAGGAVAFGIPNPNLSMTAFGKFYTEAFFEPDVYTAGSTDLVNAELTAVKSVAITVAEAGVSFARYSNFLGNHMSFGISPKIQRINTYVYTATVNNFAWDNVSDNDIGGDTSFNVDFGALWFSGPFRIGFTGMNMVSRDIDTKDITTTIISTSSPGESRTITANYSYQIRPQYTVGIGYVDDYFSLSMDYDLNEDKRFTGFDDNTQWFRAGMEIDLYRQLQLRGGYKKNLAYSDWDDTYTMGIGLSPLGLFEMDIALSYTSKDAKGAYVNFLATY